MTVVTSTTAHASSSIEPMPKNTIIHYGLTLNLNPKQYYNACNIKLFYLASRDSMDIPLSRPHRGPLLFYENILNNKPCLLRPKEFGSHRFHNSHIS